MPPAKTTTSIQVATLNIQNIKTNIEYAHHLLENSHILCLQEHWLYAFEETSIKELFPNCSYHLKCIDDKNPISPWCKPKGEAGVITLWKEELDQHITALADGSSRCVLVKIGTANPTFLLNTYMPATGSKDSYLDVLDEVYEINKKYSVQGNLIWLGDLNASYHRPNPSANDSCFRKFCSETLFEPINSNDSQATYHHFTGGITSRIDHILLQKSNKNAIEAHYVEERHPLNLSPHDPIVACMAVDLQEDVKQNADYIATKARSRPRWKKIDAQVYGERTAQRLECLIQQDGLSLPTEVLVERVNHILLTCADECAPTLKKQGKRKTKYPWAPCLKPLVKMVKKVFYVWKKNGRIPNDHAASELETLKKSFRSQQRQMVAEHRRTMLQNISTASTDDRLLFYQLVRKQRGTRKVISSSIEFKEDCNSQLEGWAGYYEQLATAEDLPHFDVLYYKAMQMKLHLVALQTNSTCDMHEEPDITKDMIEKHIRTLKTGKAADVFGLTAEHIKYASPLIVTILTTIANSVLREGKLPAQFKIGAIAPTLKKSKPEKNPDSYRRITMASTVGKVVEKEMMKQTKPASRKKQDPLQYGFTEECSPAICSLMVTEAIAEARDLDQQLFIAFMDSAKAFDVVDHTILLNAMYDLEIDPHLWRVYHDMYAEVLSRVRVNGELSRVIKEGRGIRQGGETSTEGFKAKENRFLTRIRLHPASLRIGCTPIGIPTVADDNCMMAISHNDAQTQLLMAQDNAARIRYTFSSTKSKVLHIPDKAQKGMPSPQLAFNGTNIEFSEKEIHLGLARTADGKATEAVSERIQTGRRTAYQLMGAGLQGMNGISPHVSKNLVSVYVNPALLYGLESMVLEDKDITKLDMYHRSLLRMIQSLPDSTAKPAIYLLLGCLPAQALLHQKMLSLYVSILHRPGTPEYEIIVRQLTIKDLSSSSWTAQLRLVLHKYNLPPALKLVDNPPKKDPWKRSVKSAIWQYWEEKLKKEAREMKSLHFLNLNMCGIGFTHPVWLSGPNPFQVTKAAVRAMLLVGRYPLTGHRCSGTKQSAQCPYCTIEEPETIQHFVLRCTLYTDIRYSYITTLQQHVDTTAMNDDELVSIFVDPSHIAQNDVEAERLETEMRQACFVMHNRRATHDGRGSMFQWAAKRVRGKGIGFSKSKSKNISNLPIVPPGPGPGFS